MVIKDDGTQSIPQFKLWESSATAKMLIEVKLVGGKGRKLFINTWLVILCAQFIRPADN